MDFRNMAVDLLGEAELQQQGGKISLIPNE